MFCIVEEHFHFRQNLRLIFPHLKQITSVSKRDKGWTEYHYYVKKADAFGALCTIRKKIQKKLVDGLVC